MDIEPYNKAIEERRLHDQIFEMIYQLEQKYGPVEQSEALIKIKKILEDTYFETVPNLKPYIKIIEECRAVGRIWEMLYHFEQKYGPVEQSESLIKIKKILEETYTNE